MENEEKKKRFYATLASWNVPQEFGYDFLFEVFSACIEGGRDLANSAGFPQLAMNEYQVALYIVNEHAFFIATHPERKVEEILADENYQQMLASVSLDKFLTNERLAYRMGSLVSRYNPMMSTIDLYLNFILGMLSRYRKNDPAQTLIVDIMNKGFQMAKCVASLLEGGFETEAFSTWRTLHENECILQVLVKYGKPVIERYLRHIQYAIAFRGGLPTKEATDEMFVEIKAQMHELGLKSKDTKRFIEYGWLSGVPGFADIPDFKFNFRDGVQRVAGLTPYSKVYEMSSEIAHSSPLLIYSRKRYFFLFTLLNLYESFFRLEKIFTTLYMSTVDEAERNNYAKMRTVYQSELLAVYHHTQKSFASLNASAKKNAPDENEPVTELPLGQKD